MSQFGTHKKIVGHKLAIFGKYLNFHQEYTVFFHARVERGSKDTDLLNFFPTLVVSMTKKYTTN